MFSVMVQAVAYLVELGYPPLQAASIYGLIGVLTPIGIIGFAWADGRIGRHASAAISYARSEEHTSELQSLMRISYAVFCLKKKNNKHMQTQTCTTSTTSR